MQILRMFKFIYHPWMGSSGVWRLFAFSHKGNQRIAIFYSIHHLRCQFTTSKFFARGHAEVMAFQQSLNAADEFSVDFAKMAGKKYRSHRYSACFSTKETLRIQR
jgi:hypothetical protein